MNKFCRITLISVACTLSLAVLGQTPQALTDSQTGAAEARRREPVATQVDRITRRLNLTEEQKVKIQPILRDEAQQARAIRQDTSLTPEQRRGKLRQLRDTSRAQVEALLTPEQVARMPRPGRGHAMARIARRLNLSEEQKSKIKPLLADQHQQVQAVRSDASLTPDQKREKVQEIRISTHEQVLALLTPEQQQQLRAMRDHRRHHGTESTQTPPTP